MIPKTREQWIAVGAGMLPEHVVAKRVGCAVRTVGDHRRKHGIPSYTGRRESDDGEKEYARQMRRDGW